MGTISIRDEDGGPGQLAPDGKFYLTYLKGNIPPAGFSWITSTPIPNFGTAAAPITAGPAGSADLTIYANIPAGPTTTFDPVNPDGSPLTLPSGMSLASNGTLSWTGAVVALVTLKLKPTVDGTPLSNVLSNTFTFVVVEPDSIVLYEPLAASGYTGINPSSFTPDNPGDLEEGNYILWPILDQSNTATIATPANTDLLYSNLIDTRRRFYLFGARAGASETARTFIRTGGTSGSVTDQVFCQPHRLANVPATSIIGVQPVKSTNSTGAQNVAHAAITPDADQQSVGIYVTKRDSNSTALSKSGFTQAFCFANPGGSGSAGQTGTLGLVYQTQTTATAISAGSVTVTGGSATAVSTSYILTIKRTESVGTDDSYYIEHISTGQPLSILPGHHGQGTDTLSGRDLTKCWKFFINSDTTSTSLSDTALAKDNTLKCLSGGRQQAGLVAHPETGAGPMYIFDMRSGVYNPGGGINMNGDRKWWTTAWAPGAPIYRNCKFSVNGSRAGVDNVTTWNSDDAAGGNWRNRDAIAIGGSESLQLDHIFLHNIGFARFSDEGVETFYRPKNLALLYMLGYDPLCFNDHQDEQYPELLGPHGFGSFMRGEYLNFGRSAWIGMQSRAPMDNFWRSNLFNCLYFANHPPRGSEGGANKYHSSTAYTCIDLDNQASGVSAYDTNRRHNVLGNIFARGYYQSTTMHAIGGNGMANGTGRMFPAKNHCWGYASAPVNQNGYRWESHPVSSTLLTEAWHPSFGSNHETVRRFGVADLLTNLEMLAAIDIFEATTGAHPKSANRVARELAIFQMMRNMVNGLPASFQYEPPNSCNGTTPFDKDDWYDAIINPATLLPYTVPLNGGRFLPNAGGTPSITPQTNWQGTYADTLDFLNIPQNAATAGAAYSSGTFSNGRSRVGYNPIDVSIIERKWAIGNVKF